MLGHKGPHECGPGTLESVRHKTARHTVAGHVAQARLPAASRLGSTLGWIEGRRASRTPLFAPGVGLSGPRDGSLEPSVALGYIVLGIQFWERCVWYRRTGSFRVFAGSGENEATRKRSAAPSSNPPTPHACRPGCSRAIETRDDKWASAGCCATPATFRAIA